MERQLPKNVRQIGNVSDNPKIYVEDYVDTYLNQLREKAREQPVGVILTGELLKLEDENAVFVSGAVQMKEVKTNGNDIEITDEIMKEAKEEADEEVIDIEAKPEITFDDFGKMQFQVGEIIACEEVKKSKKLLCSQVQIGSQVRQIVSGIKAHYSAEEMVGKKVMVVTNLKPAKLAGILSEGMILCAEDADGNLSLMVPEKEMPAGAEIC